MMQIPQSTSFVVVFKAFLSSDHVSEATGKTIAITISKAGGAFGNPNAGATNATEISSGWYKFTLDTTDTNTLGIVAWRGTSATIDDAGGWFGVVKATNGGLTALPDAAAEASGGLYTRGTGAGQIKQDANGRIDVNVRALLDTAWLPPAVAGTPDVNAKQIGGQAASLNANNLLKVALNDILATALTETSGQLAGGFKKFFNVATPTGTVNSIPDAVAGAAGGLLVDDVWTDARAAKLDNLDATISSRGTSTLTQTQVTGGAYALNSASFAFNAALPLTTQQKADVNAEADTALSDVGLTSTVTGRIDVAISTRLASASYTAPDNATISTISTNLSALITTVGIDGAGLTAADDAVIAAIAALSIPTAVEIAQQVFLVDMADVQDTAPEHSLCYVVLASTEVDATDPTDFKVYKTDGTTLFATKSMTKSSGDDPIRKIE